MRHDLPQRPAPDRPGGEIVRGWPVLVMALVGVGTSVSALLLYSLGALIVPLEQAFGWSRADLQLVSSFIAAGGALSVNAVGWLNARHGMRTVSRVSLVLLSIGLLGMTQLPVNGSIGWLYLGYFLLPLLGVGTTPVTWTQWVNLWFERHRGFALSLVLCGTGVAAAVLPPAITWVVGRSDWRAGFVLLAVLPLLLTLPWAARTLPVQVRASSGSATGTLPGLTFAQAARTRAFWLCNGALSLVVAGVVGMVSNTVPLLRDLGLSAVAAGAVFSVFGLSLIAGRLLVGVLLDRFWAPAVAAVTLSLPAIGCALFWQADGQTPVAALMLATALVGVGSGAEFDIAAYLVARYFGLRDYGKTFGVHLGVATIGSAIAPFLFAALLRAGMGYGPLLQVCMACFLIGPVLLLGMGRYPRFDDPERRSA
jgi:MFS family permease